jgi:carbonic anhydrase/acetyltransferase-like protein (isoleucine patch superfamily)
MALILPVKGNLPVVGENSFIAPNATLVGELALGHSCSVWFNAVLRADVNRITIGNKVNIQDNVVIHCTYKGAETVIGNSVSIGHSAIVHGCTVHDQVLIGMGAIVMDHAVLESFTIIAAGSVVLENTICESGYIYAGSPARKVKPLNEQQRQLLEDLPDRYIMYAGWFNAEEES